MAVSTVTNPGGRFVAVDLGEAASCRPRRSLTERPAGEGALGPSSLEILQVLHEIVSYGFALRGCAKEAERALEEACIRRVRTLRPTGRTPTVRSDNGLIFQSRRFRAACRDCRLRQEFITPYTPEKNGMIERFFRSLEEESICRRNFRSFRNSKREIAEWIEWYNTGRPHQALGYGVSSEFRAQQLASVARNGRSTTFGEDSDEGRRGHDGDV